MALINFNAAEVEPMGEYTPIPAGDYVAVITASEEKQTKDYTGSFVKMDFEVIDGEFKGRKEFTRLNLNNKNPQAVDIARRELSSICHATGVLSPRDSSELHNKPMIIKVAIKPATAEFSAANEIKGYKAMTAKTEEAQGQKKPWEK
jgi:hypothetical protein